MDYARRIVIDPVCEMDVKTETSPGISFSGRRIYHFCSIPCKQEFDRNPQFYLARISRSAIEARHRYDTGKKEGRRYAPRRSSSRVAVPAF